VVISDYSKGKKGVCLTVYGNNCPALHMYLKGGARVVGQVEDEDSGTVVELVDAAKRERAQARLREKDQRCVKAHRLSSVKPLPRSLQANSLIHFTGLISVLHEL
jgi:hypothetical protein